MTHAALGVRMHSGWGVLVAVSGDPTSMEVADRRRIVVTDPSAPGAKQPYHHAVELPLRDADRYLAACAASSARLALAELSAAVRELESRRYRIVGATILLASGRPLPPLPDILASHPLLHTAEGEFFRRAVVTACEQSRIAVTGIRGRDLEERASAAFGRTLTRVRRHIATMGRTMGPPWTADHKSAALAASLLLSPEVS